MSNRPRAFARLTRLALVAATAAVLATGPRPALADNEGIATSETYPDLVTSFRYPGRIPVRLNLCEVVNVDHHLIFGFTFENVRPQTARAVEISTQLFDPFHQLLTTLTTTFTGTYTTNARIDVPAVPTPGDRMPLVRAFDAWPTAQQTVCYVSRVRFEDGSVWTAPNAVHPPHIPLPG